MLCLSCGPRLPFSVLLEPFSSRHGISIANVPAWSWIVSGVAWFVGLLPLPLLSGVMHCSAFELVFVSIHVLHFFGL